MIQIEYVKTFIVYCRNQNVFNLIFLMFDAEMLSDNFLSDKCFC